MTDPLAVGPNTPPPVTTDAKASAKSSGGAIAAFTGGALLVIFMVQNTEDVTLQLFFWEFTWPLWLVVLLSATLGALIWLGLGIIRRHRRRGARRDARRQ